MCYNPINGGALMASTVKPYSKPRPLSSRQRAFCVNYASGMTLTDAYIKAGYPNTSAEANSSRLMINNAEVKAYYNQLVERKENLSIVKTVDEIMQPHEVKARLSELARANLVDFLDPSGRPKLSKDTPHHAAARKFYRKSRIDRNGNPVETSEIALVDQIEALRELAKIHGMYAPEKHMVAKRVTVEMVDKRRGDTEK